MCLPSNIFEALFTGIGYRINWDIFLCGWHRFSGTSFGELFTCLGWFFFFCFVFACF